MDDPRLQSLHSELLEHAILGYRRMAAWSESMRVPGVRNQLGYLVLMLSQLQSVKVIELPNQTALAELLGTTRETVGRALAVLEDRGAIRRLARKKFEVFRNVLVKQLTRRAGRTIAQAPSLAVRGICAAIKA
jgi:DNA-binding MarR family transcriptional regulator